MITPKMIEAGVRVVHGFESWFDLSPGLEELLVQEILEAALAASLAERNGAVSSTACESAFEK